MHSKAEEQVQTPFILGFLEQRVGAMSATTSGPVDQIDAFDQD